MNSTKLLISASLLSLIPIAAYLKKLYTEPELLDRKLTLQILRTMRKKYYPLFKQMAFMADKIYSEMQFSEEQVSALIIGSGKPSNVALKQLNQSIFDEYKVTRQQFEKSCNYHKTNDIQIRMLVSELETQLTLALKGKLKEYTGSLPCWLTASKVLIIFIKLIKAQLLEQIQIYKETLELSLSKSSSQKKEIVQIQLQTDKIVQEEGLNYGDQHGAKILHGAIERYYAEDKHFQLQLNKVKTKFQQIVEKIGKIRILVIGKDTADLTQLQKLKEQIIMVEPLQN